jgi:formylglycine-generating enzyme required for sulfatase activity
LAFPFPTASGLKKNLPYEAHYGQPWETGVTVANRNFAPTPWGHYDMAGNLWEWMRQLWPDSRHRVVCAGAWFLNPRGLRAGLRNADHPDIRYHVIGVRGRVGP